MARDDGEWGPKTPLGVACRDSELSLQRRVRWMFSGAFVACPQVRVTASCMQKEACPPPPIFSSS